MLRRLSISGYIKAAPQRELSEIVATRKLNSHAINQSYLQTSGLRFIFGNRSEDMMKGQTEIVYDNLISRRDNFFLPLWVVDVAPVVTIRPPYLKYNLNEILYVV